MKKNEKKGPTEHTEGHRIFFVTIYFYFSVSLVLRSGATPQSSILCVLWAFIRKE